MWFIFERGFIQRSDIMTLALVSYTEWQKQVHTWPVTGLWNMGLNGILDFCWAVVYFAFLFFNETVSLGPKTCCCNSEKKKVYKYKLFQINK
jgi:hypothetical protein